MKKTLILLALFASITSCSTHSKKTQIETHEAPMEIIDAHVHTNFSNQPEMTSQIPYTKESIYEEFKKANVIAAVSLNSATGKGYAELSNDKIKVINCVGIGEKPNYKLIEEGIKNKKYSCLKIYLGYIHLFANDKVYRPLYSIAEKYNVPVVFHTGDTYSTKAKLKYSDPLTIDEVAVDFPKVKFVIAHIGNPWIQSAAEVAYKNPNVYVDGSALLIGRVQDYSPEELQTYVIGPISWAFGYMESPKKLMFGSDWPLASISEYAEVFKKAIPKEHWEKVFKTNAQEVFGLK